MFLKIRTALLAANRFPSHGGVSGMQSFQSLAALTDAFLFIRAGSLVAMQRKTEHSRWHTKLSNCKKKLVKNGMTLLYTLCKHSCNTIARKSHVFFDSGTRKHHIITGKSSSGNPCCTRLETISRPASRKTRSYAFGVLVIE